MSINVLAAEHITRKYHNVDTIRDINITIGQGETVALLGVSGVGKTTLFSVLAGLDRPDEGRVLLRGEDVTGMPGKIAYMMQKDLLLPHKKIVDNVALPLCLKKKDRKTDKKTARKTALALLEEFGLAHTAEQYPCELSGGMRQRVAFLRTYLASEGILLLDEPFSALDTRTKAELHAWYRDMSVKKGLTTFMITHDIEEAIVMSERIYLMQGKPGQITREITLPERDMEPAEYALTEEFLQYKKELSGLMA